MYRIEPSNNEQQCQVGPIHISHQKAVLVHQNNIRLIVRIHLITICNKNNNNNKSTTISNLRCLFDATEYETYNVHLARIKIIARLIM